MQDWGRKFEQLRDKHRRDDGSKWSGSAIERASGGELNGRYISELRRGKIQDPGVNKLLSISKAMGFDPREWFEEDDEEEEM